MQIKESFFLKPIRDEQFSIQHSARRTGVKKEQKKKLQSVQNSSYFHT